MEEKREQDEIALTFKPGGSKIKVDSISIDVSSAADVNNGDPREPKHFTIRGYVADQRKEGRFSSPFTSDVEVSNSDSPLSLELPPINLKKFRWWRHGSSLEGRDSSQGPSEEIATAKSIPSQNEGSRPKGLAKLFAKAAANEASTSQQPDKGKQLQEGEMRAEIPKDLFPGLRNALKNLPLQDGHAQGPAKENGKSPSFLKAISEAILVPFSKISLDKPDSSRKSRGMSKGAMGPPGGSVNDKATSPESSKEVVLQKSAASAHGVSKEVAMPPPGGFSNNKLSSHRSGKGSRALHNFSSQGVSKDASAMLPPSGYASGKGTTASKQQTIETPKNNARTWHRGETSAASSSQMKRHYGRRKESPRDKPEMHKAVKGFDLNKEIPQDDAAKEDAVLMPAKSKDDRVTLQLGRHEEVGLPSNLIEQVPGSAGQNLLQHNQIAADSVAGGRHEEGGGLIPKRVRRTRLISDVMIEDDLTNGEEQIDNSKAPTGASNHTSPAKINDPSAKRKASPVASHDASAVRGLSDKTKASAGDAPASGSWKKRKSSLPDSQERLGESSSAATKRNSARFTEPENRVISAPRYRSGVNVSVKDTSVPDSRKQGKHSLDRIEVEKKAKKSRTRNPAPLSLVPSRNEEALSRPPVHGGYVMDGSNDRSSKINFSADKAERVHGYEKRNNVAQIGEGGQSAKNFLQFGSNNVEDAPGDGASDCIITGSRRNGKSPVMENRSTPNDHHMNSVSAGKELWFPQLQARGPLVELKSHEDSSSTQQKSTTAEAKGRVKDIDINSIPVDDKTPEPGAADDIPMDIVELMAKHQHERLSDANRENPSLPKPNGEATPQNAYTRMLKPQASYATNGVGRQFQPSRKNAMVGYPKGPPYSQSQGHVPCGAQYSSTVGAMEGVKHWRKYDNAALSFRPSSSGLLQPVSPFNRFQGLSPSPPLNTQIWPPLMRNQVPPGGLANPRLYPQGPDMLPKGNQVSQGTISFNFANQNLSSSSQPPWNSTTSSDYPNSGGSKQKTADFLSQKANETIPAMQLLNLVQGAGGRSNTPPVNQNSEFLKKHYAPAPGPLFDPYNNFTGAGSSSRHPLFDSVGRGSAVNKPFHGPSGLPAAASSSGKGIVINEPVAVTSQDQRNKDSSSSYTPMAGDSSRDERRRAIAAGKKALVSQDAPLPSSASDFMQQVSRRPLFGIVPRFAERPSVPAQEAEVCTTNRNPAEIMDLKEAKKFMIGAEDLRRGKATPPSRLAPNARRSQAAPKGKGRERQRKP